MEHFKLVIALIILFTFIMAMGWIVDGKMRIDYPEQTPDLGLISNSIRGAALMLKLFTICISISVAGIVVMWLLCWSLIQIFAWLKLLLV